MLHRTNSHGMRRRRARALGAIAAALAIGLSLAGCVGSSASKSASPTLAADQTLRFGISGEPQPPKVGGDQGGVGFMLDSLIHRGLLTYDKQGKIALGLAQSYKQVDTENYTFKLRKGLTFSDGSPLTSTNVKHSLMYMAVPANGARTLGAMSNIKSIDTPDDLTVNVHLSTPFPDFLAYTADVSAFIAPDKALAPGGTATVGAGPFAIKQDDAGVKLVLTKNAAYYDAKAVALKTVDLVFYPDGTARTNALISGDVDLIDYVPWEQFDTLRGTRGVKIDVQNGLLMDVEFNTTSGPFANPLVREAVAYAINRDSVVKAAFFGNAKAVYGPPVPTSSPYFDASTQKLWKYDPKQAKKLLAKAGYPNGFSTSLLATSQYTFHQDTALTVQSDLRAIGIDAKLDSPDWATRNTKSGAGDYGIKVSGFGGVVPAPVWLETYLSSAPVNRSFGWQNDALMSALAQGRTGADVADRKAAYTKAIKLIGTDVPFIPLVQRGQAYAYHDNVSGFKNLPGFLTFFSGYSIADTSITAR